MLLLLVVVLVVVVVVVVVADGSSWKLKQNNLPCHAHRTTFRLFSPKTGRQAVHFSPFRNLHFHPHAFSCVTFF
jgi:hypothetical protein